MAHKRSYAAFAREDVDDAKRGFPEVSLEAWAGRRGLEFRGSELLGQFANVVPVWPDYTFNLSKGTVAPGRFGMVAHELLEIGLDPGGDPELGGGYHSLRVHAKGRGLLSFVGIDKAPPNEPFAAHSIWVPITQVSVRVPEAVLLPAFTIRTKDRLAPLGNPKLDDLGLPGYRRAASRWIDDALGNAIGAAARPLGSIPAAFADLRFERGNLALRRNGFVADEDLLDAMTTAAGAIAEGLAEVARRLLAPAPFADPLPPPDIATWPPGCVQPQEHEHDAFVRVAQELAMEQEDPIAYHRAQPACPAPGQALGMVRGTIPGTGSFGRVGFFVMGRNTWSTYRTVVIVPARPGVVTPLGGQRDEESDLYVEVADGLAHAWPRVRSVGALNAADTVAKAVTTLRRLGLADL